MSSGVHQPTVAESASLISQQKLEDLCRQQELLQEKITFLSKNVLQDGVRLFLS